MVYPIVSVETEDGETRERLDLKQMEPGESCNLTLLNRSEVVVGDYGPWILAQVLDRDTGEQHTVLVPGSYNAPGFVYEDDDLTALDVKMQEDTGRTLPRDTREFETGNARDRSILDCFFEAEKDNDNTVLLCYQNTAKGSGRTFKTYWFGVPRSNGSIEWESSDPLDEIPEDTEVTATVE